MKPAGRRRLSPACARENIEQYYRVAAGVAIAVSFGRADLTSAYGSVSP